MVAFLAVLFLILWLRESKKRKTAEAEATDAQSRILSVMHERDELSKKYGSIIDAEAKAQEINSSTEAILNKAKRDANVLIAQAQAESKDAISKARNDAQTIISDASKLAKEIRERAEIDEAEARAKLTTAEKKAEMIISDAHAEAKEIAGNALDAKANAEEYKQTAATMKRIIEGYGDEWLKPAYSLLDELAEEFGFTEAGKSLKAARETSIRMVRYNTAADCDYSEDNRRRTAIQFVIDAFNGKVDSILSKIKNENYGVLERQIEDAYIIVNKNGSAFRNARILPGYLKARQNELKWAFITQELRKKAQEEQKALRDKIREEEKARREFERAQKEAAKEEALLQKAMEKAKAMLASANEAQRAKYEAQLEELEGKLKIAEEKNQRALSMAQQTKHGTVYVISNIGSFGENVYKVGMTRRLDPVDRVRELGDASVPFPFDVHAFIESDDAPALETALHHELALTQMNKVNPRKEFFRADLSVIRKIVEAKGLEASWTMAAQAAEYRESLAIEDRIKNDPNERARWENFMKEPVTIEAVAEADE
ncbi:MAG: DUF4041 domain-containing protein [Oscillospiraceae bacterium]|nr:DUF4041 domain-containing protein [Oscillospiraceae bacterium]